MTDRFEESDIYFMHQALKEARKGIGRTSPNPCVGAVIVKDGEIIARGCHRQAGGPHAEIDALKKAGDRAAGTDMYVTLEPCSHTGRTGPCCRAIAESGIRRVCIGMLDPNPLVDGSGAEYLRRAGIVVRHGLLEDECRELNRPFLTSVIKSRPWVVMKAGMTLDGKITLRKNRGDVITGPESLRQVHRLRDRCDAILVGIGTVAIDNPLLTTRVAGRKGKNPVRIVLDTHLRIAADARVISQADDGLTWIFCADTADQEKAEMLRTHGVSIVRTSLDQSGRLNLADVLQTLGTRQITSLLVEGGAAVHGSFLTARLVDHVQFYYAPIFGGDDGICVISDYQGSSGDVPTIRLERVKHRRLGDDLLISGDVVYS